MIITLHMKINGLRVALDIRQINYFAEYFKKEETKDGTIVYSEVNEGTVIFVAGNDPFVVKEPFEEVQKLIESAGKKH